ncbi:hypothetical protein BTUL_0292g00020 [Botrytis tulipae]|uniref:Uncharacterized protein n=1 Tax=Botrytis tulipae TaxID=87230 RepID=A0A4Z1E5M4_9HELO|nr:hypothetical protein BTUL_0292g00020 [Botrytis tulipae]
MASITPERALPRMDKIMNLAARGALLVGRRTSTVSVLRDAGLPSEGTALKHVRIRFAMRLVSVARLRRPTWETSGLS